VALDPPAAAAVVLRTMASAFVDADGDLQQGPAEAAGSLPVAVAETTSAGGRVVVIGSRDAFDDTILRASAGNAELLMGSLRWLFRDDDTPLFTPASPAQVRTCEDRVSSARPPAPRPRAAGGAR
jgi:hypothetical protein